MKIAQVCPRFYPNVGGVETHVYEISKRLAKKFEVEVLTTDPSGNLPKIEEVEGVTVRRFKSFAPGEAYYFSFGLYNYLKKNFAKYDVIHAHNYHALPSMLASLTRCNRFVFTPHYHARGHSLFRDLLHRPYKLLGKRMFEKADAIVCVSKYEKSLVLKNFNVDEDRIYVIPNGVNLEEFERVGRIEKEREHGLKVILYVGRIEKYKGVDYVVEALKFLPDNYVLEIVGKGSYKPEIVKLAERLRVSDRVRFYQDLSREELIERYANADVFVLLSRHEAFGIAVAEALASKTPCIVANTSALSEWIDGRNVFGVEYPIDVHELAELIIAVSEVRVSNVKLPSWDEVVERLERVLRT